MHICEEKGGVFMNNLTMKDYWIKGIQQAVAAQGNEKTTCNMKEEFAAQNWRGHCPRQSRDGFCKAGGAQRPEPEGVRRADLGGRAARGALRHR